jgi:GxxExxY protein
MIAKDDALTHRIIGGAIEVHRAIGPGLLESAYEACMIRELADRGMTIQRQLAVPIRYKGLELDGGYRMDLLVEGRVVVELKSIARIEPIHEAQLLSYLRMSGCQIGLLINFNVPVLTQGIRRMVNGFSP